MDNSPTAMRTTVAGKNKHRSLSSGSPVVSERLAPPMPARGHIDSPGEIGSRSFHNVEKPSRPS